MDRCIHGILPTERKGSWNTRPSMINASKRAILSIGADDTVLFVNSNSHGHASSYKSSLRLIASQGAIPSCTQAAVHVIC